MPKKEKRKCHNSLAIPQMIRRLIYRLIYIFAHTVKTCQNLTSPLKLVHSWDPTPSHFPSKTTHFGRSPGTPYYL